MSTGVLYSIDGTGYKISMYVTLQYRIKNRVMSRTNFASAKQAFAWIYLQRLRACGHLHLVN